MDTSKLRHDAEQDVPAFRRLAEESVRRCRVIAGCSETAGSITRTFLSEPMRECHEVLSRWMVGLGMRVQIDAAGNLRGLLGSGERPRLLMGSHLDSVPDAGAFDGVLGVCLALAVLEALSGTTLPFDVEVVGFSEEEGVRFRTPFLGSLALVGGLDSTYLAMQDGNGCSLQEAIRVYGLDPAEIPAARMAASAFAYLEFHIEQGPVLELASRPLAVVTAIAGQSRLECTFEGAANHAGTTPMGARRDALGGAAEWISEVERLARTKDGLVATIGSVAVQPGATNVIPGRVRASLDVRHADDATRREAVHAMLHEACAIAGRRGLAFGFEERRDQRAVAMDEKLVTRMEAAIQAIGETPARIVSGAGHDAMIIADRIPCVMLFLRSIGGLSHHPDEDVHVADVEKAIRVGARLLTMLDSEKARDV